MESTQFDANSIVGQLKKRGASKYICPVCRGKKFTVQSEIATINLTNKEDTINLGSFVPCAMMLCTNCGNIQFFAIEILKEKENGNAGVKE